jgi:hypothetical protein
VRDFTGNEEYQFGDITKAAVSKFTGKDEYEFGDISKKVGQMLFGNKQALTYVLTLLTHSITQPTTGALTADLTCSFGMRRSRRRRRRTSSALQMKKSS